MALELGGRAGYHLGAFIRCYGFGCMYFTLWSLEEWSQVYNLVLIVACLLIYQLVNDQFNPAISSVSRQSVSLSLPNRIPDDSYKAKHVQGYDFFSVPYECS